ncbi:VOC family protein [Microbacterium gorillae]|uniref:VOC family protein n=1 Tax=Microbacterium gorillae TaxID=1231063 RepID=UPI00058E4047|nr:VOC family protein [Microbacterium gorillae]
MDMMRNDEVAAAGLADWRMLAQGLHARFLTADFRAGADFASAIADAVETHGHSPRLTVGDHWVDLEVVSPDAVYRTEDGTEYVVEWVTQQDVDLARIISTIARDRQLVAEPASVSEVEIGLDTADASAISPMWAALLTGDAAARGRGTPGDEIRDATVRVPNLWFDDESEISAQRFHVEVYVAPEVVAQRIADAVAGGGTIVDDSESPRLTVLADAEGNRGVICAIGASTDAE